MGDESKSKMKMKSEVGPAPEPAHRDDIVVGRDPHRCPFCHEGVRLDATDQVACRSCLARHHAACWTEAARCAACGRRDALGNRTGRGAGAIVVGLALAASGALAVGLVLARRGDPAPVVVAPRPTYPPLDLAGPPVEVTARLRAQAEAGDPAAMNLLGFRLLRGEGCARDEAEAYRWGLRSAEAGHAEAMFGVATLLEQGLGAPRDEAAAAAWYRRAVAAGDTMAGPALERLLARRPDLR